MGALQYLLTIAKNKFIQITYSGMVEWRSPEGNLIQFEDSGEATVNSTSITLSPLIPGTAYTIKVSAVTPQGRGEQISTTGAVLNSVHQGKYQACYLWTISLVPISSLSISSVFSAILSEDEDMDEVCMNGCYFIMQIAWPTFNCDFHRLSTVTTTW